MARFAATGLRIAVLLLLVGCGAAPVGVPAEAPGAFASASSGGESERASAVGAAAGSSASPGATGATSRGQLTVFAAASLTEAFTEIGAAFDAANASQTTFNFAGSQQLAQQIVQGAPADVFASANRAQMEVMIAAGSVSNGSEQSFARNRLVVIHPADNPAQLATLADLSRPGVKLVLAAPAVPVGQYALDMLRRASQLPQYTSAFSPTVLGNVVSYEENVRAVLSKVMLGEADAGIVYSSDAAPDVTDVGRIEIPDELNTIASYPIAPVTSSAQPALARAFVDFVLSPAGQATLQKYGFVPAASDAVTPAGGRLQAGNHARQPELVGGGA